MDFEVLNIRKIDSSTGNFKLHEDYILSYDHFDGWSERLLSLGIYIDIIFECKVRLHFLDKNMEQIEKQFECEIPSEIKTLILGFINLDQVVLKHYYADMFLEDETRQNYVINHSGKSHNITIGTLLKKPQPENIPEELFFNLIDLFKKWREDIYQECLKELALSNQITIHEKRKRRK
ncbi:hypothetical protein SAMN02927916_1758 [Flavobacterium anhuiense]|uniref:Uncharacterized protein n=1 Tax=Flavobacterium anhuiense TaxID=459526 RepID=A0ABY0LKW5_9FLAO|nr:hypothetical protein [Flavobacterium anhuiense]SCY29386.1 hypothetical protein SAMN02927916_1758 [Flavobacterium anhuiense]